MEYFVKFIFLWNNLNSSFFSVLLCFSFVSGETIINYQFGIPQDLVRDEFVDNVNPLALFEQNVFSTGYVT